MRIVFFGTSNVALPVLEALYKHHEVLAVVTIPAPSPVAVLASELALTVFKPETVKDNLELITTLERLNADIFIVISYGKILPLDIINLPKFKTLNIHFSLLPKYRGAAPIQYALLNGDTITGTSIFILDQNMDTGSILAQKEIPIDADDNFLTLAEKSAYISAELLLTVLPEYENGVILPREQDNSLATSTKIITKEDGKIDWNHTAAQIYNKFRAFYEWPEIWSLWRGVSFKITDCVPLAESSTDQPGTVLSGGAVVCGNSTVLQINQLQLAGKNETDIKSFLNGYREFVGSKLG